jgi:hypothetical protein
MPHFNWYSSTSPSRFDDLAVLARSAFRSGANENFEIRNGVIMNLAVALALLAGGILLTIFGVNAMNSVSSDISRFFTGAATDRAIWTLVGGLVMGIVGLVLLMQSRGR